MLFTALNRIWKNLGPIVLSALSLFICFHILEPLACAIDPHFTLLANRSVGKIAFTVMVIYQIVLFFLTRNKSFLDSFFHINIAFYKECRWIKLFSAFFVLFFIFHALVMYGFSLTGFVTYNPNWGHVSTSLMLKMAFGFLATFLLAWTEELIFRGTIYQYFVQEYQPLTSALITSAIFSLSHNITAPWVLATTRWRLGLGLFLLGLFLNLLFIITKKLYVGMGAHAGLVFVKVVLRRAPLITFAGASAYSWLLAEDLRQSHIVHGLFLVINGVLMWWVWQNSKVKRPKTP